ncbi:MAG: TonB-dependent receptor, partial [Saprospiraceae bacterium]|nr:TonB-dependent receptor [Saprospiraceae bacterium]
ALDEALQYAPGVFSMDGLNFSQDLRIAIRGFGSRAAFGVRGIKVLIDGIPATTPDGQTQLDHLNVQSLDGLEVMTGAVGGMYGNASGGAISLYSNMPKSDGVRITSTVGSFGLWRNQVQMNKVAKDWIVELGANHLTIDGYRENSAAKSLNINSRITYQRPKTQYQLLAHFTDSPLAEDPGGIDLQSVEENRRQARAQNVSFAGGEEISQFLVGINANHKIGLDQKIEAKIYYINRDFTNLLPFESGGAVAFNRDFSGANFQYTLEKTKYRLLLGAETERQKDARERSDNEQGTIGSLTFKQDEYFGMIGLYALQEVKLLPGLSLDLNTRLDLMQVEADDKYLADGDQSGKINWEHLSPSLGLNYRWSPDQHVFIMAGHSFETPALSELSNSPDGGGGFNENLNPQRANHYEIGLKGYIQKWFYQLSAFHIDLRDELLPFEIQSFPGRTFYRNAGASRRNGLEFTAKGELIKNVSLSGAYTLSDFSFSEYQLDGIDLNGNTVSGIPENYGSLGLAYNGEKGLFAKLDFIATGQLFADDLNKTTVDGYQVIHIRAGQKLMIKNTGVKVHAGVRNLGNVEYFDNVRINAFGGRYYEPAPGRHYFGGIMLEL